jgi:hypothetical protein
MATGNPWADSNVVNFALFRELPHPPGGYPNLVPLQPNAAEFPLVACALNLARDVLGTQAAREVLLQLAMAWDAYYGRVHFTGNADLARQDVDFFIAHVRNRLPKVIVDENMTNPDILGSHSRLAWQGQKMHFRSGNQTVQINAGVRKSRETFCPSPFKDADLSRDAMI